MKQIEKLDLILKALYETRFEGFYPLTDICREKALPVELTIELRRLAKRLQTDNHIDIIFAQKECFAQITHYGMDFCQRDSYSKKGKAILSENRMLLKSEIDC